MLTRASARTASRSELRDKPSSAARSASLGSLSPARRAPDRIIDLIFSMASSVTATASLRRPFTRSPPHRTHLMSGQNMAWRAPYRLRSARDCVIVNRRPSPGGALELQLVLPVGESGGPVQPDGGVSRVRHDDEGLRAERSQCVLPRAVDQGPGQPLPPRRRMGLHSLIPGYRAAVGEHSELSGQAITR